MKLEMLMFHLFCAMICFLGSVLGGRSFNTHLPIFKGDESQPPIKVFDGNRLTDNSIVMVYYHDLSVAVVELGPEKLLLNCNVIEIFSPDDIEKAMGSLRDKTTPVPITLQEMLHLMNQCAQLDQFNSGDQTEIVGMHEEENKNFSVRIEEARAVFNNHLVLFRGIVPGTKWCGTGDVAKDYHDLGEDILTDICCRTHDLCPVKIRAFMKKYDLSNDSIYTKSHCNCDDMFHSCMKRLGTKSAQILGQIYFNLVKVPCLQDGKEGRYFRKSKEF